MQSAVQFCFFGFHLNITQLYSFYYCWFSCKFWNSIHLPCSPPLSILYLTIFRSLLLALAATLSLILVFISRYRLVAAIYQSKRSSPLHLTAKRWLSDTFSVRSCTYPMHLLSPLAISWRPLRRILISTLDPLRTRRKMKLHVFERLSFACLICRALVF